MRTEEEELLELYTSLHQADRELRHNAIAYYEPHPTQLKFHSSAARIRILLGGNRSGKSTAGACEAIAHALGVRPWLNDGHPQHTVRLASGRAIPVPNIGTVLGESYKVAVDRVLWPTLSEWLPPDYVKRVGKNQQAVVDTVELRNGSMIRFMAYNQAPKEFEGYKAHWSWYDEPPPRDIFVANERSLVDYGGRSWFTLTPIRMPWIWEDLISPEDDDLDCEVFRMTSWDNPHVTEKELKAYFSKIKDPAERHAREVGEFLHLQGRVFPEWEPKAPYWVPAVKPKDEWVRIMGIDPHPRKPVACVWVAVSPDSDIWYVYRELYTQELRSISDVCAHIHELEKGEKVKFRIIDPSSQENERTSDSSVYEQFLDELCPHPEDPGIELARKSDKDGRRRLIRGMLEVDPIFKSPELVVMDNCPRLRHEFMNHVWDDWAPGSRDSHDEKQEVKKKDDDLLDALMYLRQYGGRAVDFEPKLWNRERNRERYQESGRVMKPYIPGRSF